MELEGRLLKDFWIWYRLPENKKKYKTNSLIGNDMVAKVRFLAMSFTERYGVFVDFFIDNEIYLTVSYDMAIEKFNWWAEIENSCSSGMADTQDLARISVIKEAAIKYCYIKTI